MVAFGVVRSLVTVRFTASVCFTERTFDFVFAKLASFTTTASFSFFSVVCAATFGLMAVNAPLSDSIFVVSFSLRYMWCDHQ